MKDLRRLSYFLGLEVALNSSSYYLSQSKYSTNLLFQTKLTNNKIDATPLRLMLNLMTKMGLIFQIQHFIDNSLAVLLPYCYLS